MCGYNISDKRYKAPWMRYNELALFCRACTKRLDHAITPHDDLGVVHERHVVAVLVE